MKAKPAPSSSWCLFLPVLVAVGLSSCKREAPQAAAPPPPAVIVAAVEQKTVPIYVENVGQTQAASTVEIRARVSGFITEAPFKEGSMVKKGDLLFRIDPRPYQAIVDQTRANVTKAEASMERAKADLARLEPLAAASAISKQDRDTAVTTVKVAEADVLAASAAAATAELDLGYTTMVAPFDGVIGARNVDVGNYVGNGASTSLLATVSTTDPMRVSFNVAEQNYLRFQRRFMDDAAREEHSRKMEFTLILGDGTTYEHQGRFEFADRALDPRTGTLKIVVSFPNAENLLKPGQFARIRAKTEEKPDALLVPQRAVVETQNMRSVMVVGADNKVTPKPVQTEGRFEDAYIVKEGVQAGDRVIIEGIQKARPGMTVNPQENKPGPAAASPPPAAAEPDKSAAPAGAEKK